MRDVTLGDKRSFIARNPDLMAAIARADSPEAVARALDDAGPTIRKMAGLLAKIRELQRSVVDRAAEALARKCNLPKPVLDALVESIESIEAKEKAGREARCVKVKNSGENAATGAAAEGVIGAPEEPREGAAEAAWEPREGAVEASAEASAGATEEASAGATEEASAGATEEATRGSAGIPHRSAVVERACGEAGKILGELRKRNRKKGRPMGRSMGALDELLHGKLKLLHIPRSA